MGQSHSESSTQLEEEAKANDLAARTQPTQHPHTASESRSHIDATRTTSESPFVPQLRSVHPLPSVVPSRSAKCIFPLKPGIH